MTTIRTDAEVLTLNAEGTRLVNYGQWVSAELYRQARARPEFESFSTRVERLAESIDPFVCSVVFTEEFRAT
ncbi:hypothetical protein ACWDSJ_10505 [Nocardia sp. NPDC003482]